MAHALATTIVLLLLCKNNHNTIINAQTITASYDPTFNAPSCLTPAMKCETDNTPGGGIYGVSSFEYNSPNTIDSCNDYSNSIEAPQSTNTSTDEYIAVLKVRNTDGLIMTGGTSIRITSRVMTASNTTTRAIPDTEEIAHIYYTANASATPINWEYVTTKVRQLGAGYVTVQSNHMLAHVGGLQAVRINYGYGIYTPQECASDGLKNGESYVDVDDLVFYVEPGPPTSSPTLSPTNTEFPTMMPSISNVPTVISEVPTSLPSSTPSTSLEPTIPVTAEPTTTSSPTSTQVPSTAPSNEDDDGLTFNNDVLDDDDDDEYADDDDESIFERLLPFLPRNSSWVASKGSNYLCFEAIAILLICTVFAT